MTKKLDITKNKGEASALLIDRTTEEITKEEASSLQIVLGFTKLAVPASITRLCFQVSFVCHFVAREFEDTKKVAAVGVAISMMMFC